MLRCNHTLQVNTSILFICEARISVLRRITVLKTRSVVGLSQNTQRRTAGKGAITHIEEMPQKLDMLMEVFLYLQKNLSKEFLITQHVTQQPQWHEVSAPTVAGSTIEPVEVCTPQPLRAPPCAIDLLATIDARSAILNDKTDIPPTLH